MILGERIRQLRVEQDWNQSDLASRIGTDRRQISRYENGHITPSLEVLSRIAKSFNTSADYLLFDDVPRRPLYLRDQALAERLGQLHHLSAEDKASLIHVLDALVARSRMRSITRNLD